MKEFITQVISDVDIDQVIITRSKDEDGNEVIRVRSNVSTKLVNKLDAGDTHLVNIPINTTAQELGVGASVLAILNAILSLAKSRA